MIMLFCNHDFSLCFDFNLHNYKAYHDTIYSQSLERAFTKLFSNANKITYYKVEVLHFFLKYLLLDLLIIKQIHKYLAYRFIIHILIL